MNIQMNRMFPVDSYASGHKEARHAAAEIALEADRMLASQQWQDISTAPKDGTKFIAFEETRSECRIYECCWHDEFSLGHAYWLDDYDSEPDPTHWMPLPEPPKGDA